MTASTVSLSDKPCKACNVITAAITSAGTLGRPRPSREQIGEHLIGEQLPPMRRQERKNAVRLQKMTRYRLRIQQLTLIIRSTLHTKIIANNQRQQADRHAGLFRAFLAGVLENRKWP